ncbi:MAG: tRNA (guanosine(46)-N7)-methyltransferase TrmB [Lentihominibacter sp.]|jgi:tRNA (guanine-N7-)-methyltransferase
MRQRKPKDLEKRLHQYEEYTVRELSPGIWNEIFEREGGLYLEIGCGKGDFIVKKAVDNPDCNYIAIEGQNTVVLRALEKTAEAEADGKLSGNLKFVIAFMDNMSKGFKENQLDGIYLNFSDPWPKARHAKRRLTYHERLSEYARAIRPDGFIEFKTDNDDFFSFTLEEINAAGKGEGSGGFALEIEEMTRDLHSADCPYESRKTMTEYEKKFSKNGKNINYVKVIVRKKTGKIEEKAW